MPEDRYLDLDPRLRQDQDQFDALADKGRHDPNSNSCYSDKKHRITQEIACMKILFTQASNFQSKGDKRRDYACPIGTIAQAESDMVQNRDISSTFIKGMSVLKAFDGAQAQMTISEVARKTSIDAATARRLVLTLVHLGYLKKIDRNFSLTPRVLVLAGSFLGANQFGRLVQPILNRHGADLGRGISVAMKDGDKAILVAQSSLPNTKMTFGFTVGSHLPLFHTAIGRMLLAMEEQGAVEKLLMEASLKAHTPLTALDRDNILENIHEASVKGFCVVHGEFEHGVTGIAVPSSAKGDFSSVIGISDVTESYETEADLKPMVVGLKRCAAELAQSNVL